MTAGIILLGVSIFFAGCAFQEAITGTSLNTPDGGYGSLIYSLTALVIAYRLIMSARRAK